MNSSLAWSAKQSKAVSSVAISPDGSRLIASNESKVNIYDLEHGNLLLSPRGHKGTVNCLSFSFDGQKFASGANDGTVVVWSKTGEGVLKYSHSDAIKCVQFSPVADLLASVAQTELGLWSPSTKSVMRHSLLFKALCASWTKNGKYFAVGYQNGSVSIRRNDDEANISCGNQPIVRLCWTSSPSNDQDDILVACTWTSMLFLKREGCNLSLLEKTKKMNFYTLTMNSLSSSYGDYLFLGGSNNDLSVYSRDGSYLTSAFNSNEWTLSSSCNSSYICTGGSNGSLSLYRYSWTRIICQYSNLVAYSESLSDVIIEMLSNSNKRVRIRCRDTVKGLCLSGNQLVILLYSLSLNSYRLNVYQDEDDEDDDEEEEEHNLHYKLRDRLSLSFLVPAGDVKIAISSDGAILLSQANCLYHVTANKQVMHESPISCLYCTEDDVLVAGVDGSLSGLDCKWQYCITNISMSSKKDYGMLVDSQNQLLYYHKNKLTCIDLTGDLVVSAGCIEFDGIIGYAYCKSNKLHLISTDLSSTSSFHCPVNDVIKIDQDGVLIGLMKDGSIVKHLLSRLCMNEYKMNDDVMMGRVWQSMDGDNNADFRVQVRGLLNGGNVNAAVAILTDMCQFDQIRQMDRTDSAISKLESNWLLMMGDVTRSSQLCILNQEWKKAIDVMMSNYSKANHDAICDGLMNVVRQCDDGEILSSISSFLLSRDDMDRWKDCMMKIGNIDGLVSELVKRNMWTDALAISPTSIPLNQSYASHLKACGNYEEAIKCYQTSCDWPSRQDMILTLAGRSIDVGNYAAAGYYYYMLSDNAAKMKDQRLMDRYSQICAVCHGYSKILVLNLHGISHCSPETMINCLCFVINMMERDEELSILLNLARSTCLVSLARISYQLKYFKLARSCLGALSSLAIKDVWIESVDAMFILLQSKPVRDEGQVRCYRCGSINQLLTRPKQDGLEEICGSCRYRLIRCGLTFDVLPLLEFEIAGDLNDVEVIDLLSTGRLGSSEAFNNCIIYSLQPSSAGKLIQVSDKDLPTITRRDVFCFHDPIDDRSRWLINMMPDLKIGYVAACRRFFHLFDIELALLSSASTCPISGIKDISIIYHV